jgi:ketosteroid isomerase-like protein
MRYAAAVDRRDWELLDGCFAPDVKATGWKAREGFTGRAELTAFIRGVAHFSMTMHMMSNELVAVDGDRAALDTYAMLTHHRVGDDGQVNELNRSGARYREKLARDGGCWRIVERGGEPRGPAEAMASDHGTPRDVTAAGGEDPAVRALLDRAEIHDLLMGYARAIDERDYERVVSCFADRFTAFYGSQRFHDHQSLADFVRGVEHFASTTHFFGHPVLHVHGDEAWAQTYAMITHRPTADDEAAEWTVGGPSYWDRLVREGGRWRVAERGEQVVPADRILTGPVAVAPLSPVASVRWLTDREEIRQLVAQVALASDRRRVDVLEACLSPDFEQVDESGRVQSRGQTVETLRSSGEAARACSFLGNHLVDLDGDHARAETYAYLAHTEGEGRRLSPWSHGAYRFVDDLVRQNGRWLLGRRQVLTNWIERKEMAGV